jgi:hypothetical protein
MFAARLRAEAPASNKGLGTVGVQGLFCIVELLVFAHWRATSQWYALLTHRNRWGVLIS